MNILIGAQWQGMDKAFYK